MELRLLLSLVPPTAWTKNRVCSFGLRTLLDLLFCRCRHFNRRIITNGVSVLELGFEFAGIGCIAIPRGKIGIKRRNQCTQGGVGK